MQSSDSNPEKSATHTESQQPGQSKLRFLSNTGLAFSIVSVLCSSFVFYKFFELQQDLSTTRETVKQALNALNSAPTNPANQPSASPSLATPPANPEATNQVPDESTNPATQPANLTESQTTPATTESASVPTEVKPGEYVQPAFEEAAKVELLQVNRIQERNSGKTNVVNIRFRVRRVADIPLKSALISANRITGRHPTTSQDYKAHVSYLLKYEYQEPIDVLQINKGASVDAYVWLEVPEEVKAIDILIPNTEEFANVPIKDLSNPN